jgi:hypothetical protein
MSVENPAKIGVLPGKTENIEVFLKKYAKTICKISNQHIY